MKLKDIYRPDAVTVDIDDNLAAAARRMEQAQVGALAVLDEAGQLVGILTVDQPGDRRAARDRAGPGADRTRRHAPAARSPTESILARGLWQHALWVGLTMAIVCLAVLVWARALGWPWQTMVFTTLALLQLGHALAVRSERESFFTLGPRSNPLLLGAVAGTLAVQLLIVYVPALQVVFDTEPLAPVQLAVVLAAATVAFIAVEIEKWIRRRTHPEPINRYARAEEDEHADHVPS